MDVNTAPQDQNNQPEVDTGQVQPQAEPNPAPAQEAAPVDDDPILASMRAAEEELAKGNDPEPGQGGENAPAARVEGQNPDQGGQNAPQATPQGDKPGQQQPSPMIPKARLDEVLQERDQLRSTAQYLQGVVDTQTRMMSTATQAAPQGNQQAGAPAAPQPQAATLDQQIAQAEAKKLELAEKYDAGDLSTKEYQEQVIGLDRQIRTLSDQSHQALVTAATQRAQAATQQTLMESQVNSAALKIQAEHPYVSVIDQHHNGAAIWNMIDAEAQQALIQKGINPHDGTAASRVALMNEKAALADKYGPTLTGVQVQQPQVQTNQQQQPSPGLSPVAQARLAKIDVANQQPPASGSIGNTGQVNQISDDDIMKMSQDEIAALPASVLRRFTGA